jgi:hypothetical protein
MGWASSVNSLMYLQGLQYRPARVAEFFPITAKDSWLLLSIDIKMQMARRLAAPARAISADQAREWQATHLSRGNTSFEGSP